MDICYGKKLYENAEIYLKDVSYFAISCPIFQRNVYFLATLLYHFVNVIFCDMSKRTVISHRVTFINLLAQ